MIKIIDYGAGNLRNVEKAFHFLGYNAEITDSPDALKDASHVILPGVGAFGDNMDALRSSGFDRVIPNIIEDGTPFLGICLGMQLLFEESTEMGAHTGLGIFKGRIELMQSNTLKIPHMGWNSIYGNDDIIFGAQPRPSYLYFVHSFYKRLDGLSNEYVAATCEYTEPFAAAVRNKNCIAMQYHPEKSGDVGLAMLRRFAEYKGEGGASLC